jgi:glycosyltransferase involved in cell wall biosynthesis
LNPSSRQIDILSFSLLQRDARVLRQVEYLSRQFSVTAIGYGTMDSDYLIGARVLPVEPPSGLGLLRKLRTLSYQPLGRLLPKWAYERWFWTKSDHLQALKQLLISRGDAIHANDWDALPVAVKAAEVTGAQIILDLHEYSPLQYENHWKRRNLFNPMIDYFLKTYHKCTVKTITVNEMIAQKYAQEYGFHPITILNAPKLENGITFRPTDSKHVRLIHHGVASPDRRLDLMIKTIAQTESRYSLHLMLVETIPGYLSKMRKLAQQIAPSKVIFSPPVNPREIVKRIAEFDIGFYLLPYASFNNKAALPNKFFDFIAAGLAVCVGPSPEMARLTQQFGFGIVADSFDPGEAAKLLNNLSTEQIDEMKKKALRASTQLNADVEMTKLTQVYLDILKASSNTMPSVHQDD